MFKSNIFSTMHYALILKVIGLSLNKLTLYMFNGRVRKFSEFVFILVNRLPKMNSVF